MKDTRLEASLDRVTERALTFARATRDRSPACWGRGGSPILDWARYRWLERVALPGVPGGRPAALVLHFGHFELAAPLAAFLDPRLPVAGSYPRGGPPDDFNWEREVLTWRRAGVSLFALPRLPEVVVRRDTALRRLRTLLSDTDTLDRAFVRRSLSRQRYRPQREFRPEPVGVDLMQDALEALGKGNQRTAAALFELALSWADIEIGADLDRDLDLKPMRDTFVGLRNLARSVGEAQMADSLMRSADAWYDDGGEGPSGLDLKTVDLVTGSETSKPRREKRPR